MSNDEQLRYPIGKFTAQDSYTPAEIKASIDRIEALPAKVETLVKTLSSAQLDTPYRDGGWTARQVLHHLPDSHMNAYIRVKWSLTESTPTIKAYDEKAWAETPETSLDPAMSVNLLKAVHVKWVSLLRLDRAIATYAWHGDHHLGHLEIVAGKSR
jgi:hypothetical protein